MAKITQKNESVLRAISSNGTMAANLVIEMFPDFDARLTLKSLRTSGYIDVVGTVMRKSKEARKKGKDCVTPVRVYAITDKGRMALQNIDHPPARVIKAAIQKVLKPQPKQPTQKQEQRPMQDFVIPDLHFPPGVNQMVIEVDDMKVKCIRGEQFKRAPYVPPPDHSRNYTPRPIKGIHAL